jgi:hypothetical protein
MSVNADPASPPAPEPAPTGTGKDAPEKGASAARQDDGDSPAAGGPKRTEARRSGDDEAQALPEGRAMFRSHVGTATISGSGPQEVRFGNQNIFIGGLPAGASGPGPVRSELLKHVRARYVPVPGHDDMRSHLEDNHLLVLVGPAGIGRSTTAMHLLDELTGGKIARLGPETEIMRLDEAQVQEGHGYLAELRDADTQPTEAQADRLSALLRERGGFCVIIAAPSHAVLSTFADYRRDCAAPSYEDLLDAHLTAAVSDAEMPPMRRQQLLQQGTQAQLKEIIGQSPQPREVQELAALLVEHSAHATSDGESPVERQVGALLERRVAGWFAELDTRAGPPEAEDRIRLAALRISLAVLDGLPRHVIVAAALDLGDRMIRLTNPRRRPRRPLVDEDDASLLAELHAESVAGTALYSGVSVPAEVLKYMHRRTPSTLLRHVWTHLHHVRQPVVDWLAELSEHPVTLVRVRAAQATGLLTAIDFSHTFSALIEPAAAAGPPSISAGVDSSIDISDDVDNDYDVRRIFAAIALDQAALDASVAPMVAAVLKRWRSNSEPALRWTAARTLGYGSVPIEKALPELRVIGTPDELYNVRQLPPNKRTIAWDLRWASGQSVARLFANGHSHTIATTLHEWLIHPRVSVRLLARQTVVVLAEMRMSVVVEPPAGRPAGRARWPVALGAIDADLELFEPISGLFMTALHDREAGAVLTEAIVSWFDLATADDDAGDAVVRFVAAVGRSTVAAGRLAHLVRSRREHWADPLDPILADRLDAALGQVRRVASR